MAYQFHALPKGRVVAALQSNELHGLANANAKQKLKQYGYNELKTGGGPSQWEIIWRQINSPLIYILLLANAFAAYQREWTDVTVISVVVVANAAIGYFQERKAENVMARLRQILAPTAKVIREGIEQKIAARLVVPGDVITLEAGDRVPADARILQSKNLRINQSTLTGEALPANKREATVAETTALIDRVNMIYSSTLVVSGQAHAVVVSTGLKSEIGKITQQVAELKEGPQNLERQVNRIARYFMAITIVFLLLVFAVGIGHNLAPVELIKVLISLLVSIVPEGLPVAITITLSVGLARVFRKRALIRRLSAAETLGSATVVCIDKTGTITEGSLMVEKIYAAGIEYNVGGQGYQLTGDFKTSDGQVVAVRKEKAASQLLQLASLASSSSLDRGDLRNDQAKQLTDPTETALAVVAAKAGWYAFELEKDYPEIVELPFDQDLRFSASAHQFDGRQRLIVKGSPEKILALCDRAVTAAGSERRLGRDTRAALEEEADRYAGKGYRVVALGYVDQPKGTPVKPEAAKNLTFCGFFAMTDPIRRDVAEALQTAHQAGIKVLMITGDHLKTAETIAERVGIAQYGKVIHADDIARQPLESVSVIARSTPSQKLEIVQRLQRAGQIVAMTGDGVNDATALKRADIGVAMGRAGTDVAIEASDMVLLEDSFSSIVEAIKQGRLIWENLRKVVFFLVSTSFAEILIILFAVLTDLPLPLLAVQILWMNLVTDGVNSLALTVEPAEEDLMKRPPRRPSEPILTGGMLWRMALLTATMAVGTIWVYQHFLPIGLEYARTASLTTVVFFQLFNLLNSRSHSRSIFQINLLGNHALIGTLLLSTALQLAAVYMPLLMVFLQTTPISTANMLLCIGVAGSILVVDELRKFSMEALLAWAKRHTA